MENLAPIPRVSMTVMPDSPGSERIGIPAQVPARVDGLAGLRT